MSSPLSTSARVSFWFANKIDQLSVLHTKLQPKSVLEMISVSAAKVSSLYPSLVKVKTASGPKKRVKRNVEKEVDLTKLVWRDPDKKPVDLEMFSRKIIYEDGDKPTR